MKNKLDGRLRPKAKRRTKIYADIDWNKAKELFKQPLSPSKENQLFPSTREILHVLAAAGAIGLTFAFPNAGSVISGLILGGKSYPNWSTNQVISQLKKQKYATIKENKDGSVTVKITKNGLVRALTYQVDSLIIKKPKKWDKKWRVVIFDIPEKYRRIRDIFRFRLKQLGLYRLQESVYISPYACFDEIEFLRGLYGVSFEVRYLIVEKLEEDESIKKYFKLS